MTLASIMYLIGTYKGAHSILQEKWGKKQKKVENICEMWLLEDVVGPASDNAGLKAC